MAFGKGSAGATEPQHQSAGQSSKTAQMRGARPTVRVCIRQGEKKVFNRGERLRGDR